MRFYQLSILRSWYAARLIILASLRPVVRLSSIILDLLLIFFLGIVVAAALQPAHLWLARWGVPKGIAVLAIYFLFLVTIALLGLFLSPVLFEQISTFMKSLPQQYEQFIRNSQSSSNVFLQQLGSRLPSFNTITQQLSNNVPAFVPNFLTFVTNAASFFTYFVVVLAIGFYWTMEVPRGNGCCVQP